MKDKEKVAMAISGYTQKEWDGLREHIKEVWGVKAEDALQALIDMDYKRLGSINEVMFKAILKQILEDK